MGEIHKPKNVLFILVAYSRYPVALKWSIEQFSAKIGKPTLTSSEIPFNETTYYTPSMGSDLILQMSAYHLIPLEDFPALKIFSNGLEETFKTDNSHPEERPLNLDPGYLNAHKFILATTKDADHRLYLKDGIYAESTLHYVKDSWQEWSWTYPNYKKEIYKNFLLQCRKVFLEQAKEENKC